MSVRDVRTGQEVEFAVHAEEAVLSLFPRLGEEFELRPRAELVLSLGEIQLDCNETFATNGVEEDGKLLLSYEDEGCDIRIFGDRSVGEPSGTVAPFLRYHNNSVHALEANAVVIYSVSHADCVSQCFRSPRRILMWQWYARAARCSHLVETTRASAPWGILTACSHPHKCASQRGLRNGWLRWQWGKSICWSVLTMGALSKVASSGPMMA